MRVLNIIQKPQRRGAETFAVELSRWLEAQGHQSIVVTLYKHDGQQLRLAANDVELGGNERGAFERGADPQLLRALRNVIREFAPDVVQANGGRTLKYAALARPFLGLRALWVYRNIDSPAFWLKGRAARLLMPRLVRAGFDAAIGVSKATLAEVHRFYGFSDRSVAIPNGVDFTRLQVSRPREATLPMLGPGPNRLIWVGALGPQKRPDVAVDVLAALGRNDVSLCLVGEGPWRERVHNKVVGLGLEHQVVMLGNRSDVGDLLRAGDVFLSTSDTDGQPAVVIEAQHCGLPVVCFDVGGVSECLTSEKTGIIVRHGDALGMAKAVAELLNDTPRRTQMSSLSVDAAARFDILNVGPLYEKFYREALG
jgi:glycosyltransferase involved in cell wall biosynthesis